MELDVIMNKIFEIRGQRVMLDFHLAELYGVETKVLKQAVRRNIDRFPKDFMFELTQTEFENLRSQFVTSPLQSTRYGTDAFKCIAKRYRYQSEHRNYEGICFNKKNGFELLRFGFAHRFVGRKI